MSDYGCYLKRGRCEICGEVKNGIRVVEAKVSWFRGEDEKIGQHCKKCTKEFKRKNKIQEYYG